LNLSYFISKRIREGKQDSFSSIIHKIAVGSIAIGLAAALVSFLIMHGFQSAVKNKIYGFSNHLLITKYTMNNAVEEQPFDFQITLYKNPNQFPFIKNIQEYSHKAGLIKSDDEVMGIVFKGVGKSFNLNQFQENLQEGRFVHFSDSSYSREVVLSRIIADKVNVKVGDDIVLHFFQNPPRVRRLNVVGIYETNLSEYFDGKVVLGDIRLVQQLNDWSANQAGGLEVLIDPAHYNVIDLWKNSFKNHLAEIDELIWQDPDVDFKFFRAIAAVADFSFDADKEILEESARQISESMDYDLNLETVRDKYIQVFEWLDLIKRQVKILLVIILVVVSVNMISVILILVMERTPMVGMLKAMGARDSLIRSVFVFNGVNLIWKGLFFGNAFGLGFVICNINFISSRSIRMIII
jgi:ABC-type transport system, involved in lipoprotein release, permease component